MKAKALIVAVCWGLITMSAFAGEQVTPLTVDDIVQKANHVALYQGADAKGRVSMVITDKQGRTRNRVFNMLRKDNSEADQDQRFLAFFQAPADVRKMVFMVHKHAALEKDDDRWLYMPSLDLVKRIAASDKRTSFVGSDFLYEDISGRSPAEDRHELIRTTDTHYVLKNVPRNPQSVEFAYYMAYIDKKTFMPMKMEFFKNGDRLYRVIESMKLEDIQVQEKGKEVIYRTVTLSVARDLEKGSKTEMTRSHIQHNVGLSDKIFTERYLRRPPRDAMR
ncbi:MAG: outer membrane lipoprotein-sorting protein [Thermodesulfobacteriota bacterium]|nr:outer membrane lipoprotein-sorting protein [Thermodesulfobacteriota bacterium]